MAVADFSLHLRTTNYDQVSIGNQYINRHRPEAVLSSALRTEGFVRFRSVKNSGQMWSKSFIPYFTICLYSGSSCTKLSHSVSFSFSLCFLTSLYDLGMLGMSGNIKKKKNETECGKKELHELPYIEIRKFKPKDSPVDKVFGQTLSYREVLRNPGYRWDCLGKKMIRWGKNLVTLSL